MEKKASARSIAAHQGSGIVLAAQAVKPNLALLQQLQHHVAKLLTARCHSPRPICLPHRRGRQVGWGCDGYHCTCRCQVLEGPVLCSPFRDAGLLQVYYSLGRGHSSGFCLVFSTSIASPQKLGGHVGILPVVEYVYCNYVFQNGK